MKIAINGIGVAGPTLAYWLKRLGHEPVLYEIAPELRTGGYVIDFWGLGYDIAKKMGVMPELRKKGYHIKKLKLLKPNGQVATSANLRVASDLLNGRFISIERSDVASSIYKACKDVRSEFGVSITDIKEGANGVSVTLSNGDKEDFDLVVGADGLHSKVREVVFGKEKKFAKNMGFYVAAFELKGYQPRDELTYVMHRVPGKSVSRFAKRDDTTLFLFVCRADLVKEIPTTEEQEKATLRSIFGKMEWEVQCILERMDEVKDIYFDSVSQIQIKHWSKGRVALIGDAGACASLLAGEGTGLAIIEAYVLANEIHRAGDDYAEAFENYEQILRKFIEGKQKSANKFANFFAPKNRFSGYVGNLGLKIANVPFFARMFLGATLRDDIKLPEY
jgi:2-polyprenyl-6-methoxyphenol hydroxylase-like FAD-dependent oxidoreductase